MDELLQAAGSRGAAVHGGQRAGQTTAQAVHEGGRHTARRGASASIKHLEAGWVLEDNAPMINAMANLGLEELRRYRVYEMAI